MEKFMPLVGLLAAKDLPWETWKPMTLKQIPGHFYQICPALFFDTAA